MNIVLYDCEAIMNLPLTYLIEKNTEITFSPMMFISDIRKNGVPDLDQVYLFCKKDMLSAKIEKRENV